SKPANYLKIDSQIWPVESQVLERPDRLQYVRKIIQPKECVFCSAAENSAPIFESLLVYKSKFSMIVMNKFPYNNGHLLVLPVRHCGDFLALSTNEFQDLHETLRKAVAALKEIYNPPGLNLGLNHGAVAGAGIPDHLHYHVIPRWAGDTNFFPLIAQSKAIVESLEQTFQRLLAYFEEK
ncbi:MAG: HIT domain-containing protein, partial [Pseudobdellovibrionaceae bacterium]